MLRNDASLVQSMPLLSQTLLNEKNEEIDQLTRELSELRDYLVKIEKTVLSYTTHEAQVSCYAVTPLPQAMNRLNS